MARAAPHPWQMRRCLALCLICLLLPLAALAEARPRGLLWVHSDLPRTFPLQVKSNPGTDYLLVLRAEADGRAVLAAYVRGGSFFRVLVPPGRFRVDLAAGRPADWRGEAELFGPRTTHPRLDAVLEFRVIGTARKAGHILDLRGPARLVAVPFDLCERLALDPDSLQPAPGETFARPRFDRVSRACS